MSDFLRKMYLSMVISSCIVFGIAAICVSYSHIRRIGFGEYRNALEVTKEGVRILDYEIEIKNADCR